MSAFKEMLFCIAHPKEAIEAKFCQTEVAFEAGKPPPGSTVEEFPRLPVSKAAKLIYAARHSGDMGDGVQLTDWSEADQQRMQKGERPLGIPIHRNL